MKSKYKIILILIAALVMRLISLNQSLWMDEAISATVVKNYNLLEIITKFAPADTHPPLYYLLLRFWSGLFGLSEISLRLPSVIFAVMTVYVVYKIGLIYFKKVAIWTSVLLATAPLHIYYSQEARMYSLSTLLTSLVIYLFLKKRSLLLSLALFALSVTDYLPLFILLPMWVYHFGSRNKKETTGFLLTHVPFISFLLFWSPVFLLQSRSTSSYLAKFPAWKSVLGGAHLKDLLLVWVKFILGRVNFGQIEIYVAIVIITSLIVTMPLFRALKYYKKVNILWLWLVFPVITAFAGAFFVPGFAYFRLIFVLPAFYLLIAYGITKLRFGQWFFMLFLIMNIVFSAKYLFDPSQWREDWRGAVKFVETRLQPDEKVLVAYPEPFTPYVWYAKNNNVIPFSSVNYEIENSLYTLDYLMDLTDPARINYQHLKDLGYLNSQVYNFRGVGQIRYWIKK